MITLSASSIQDFLSCSQRFYYRSHFPEESVSTPEMAVGNIIHKALEEKWDDLNAATLLTATLAKEYNISTAGLERIDTCLLNYASNIHEGELANLYRSFSKDDPVEYKFKEKLFDDIYITGKMDRIVVSQDVIIDWKTGSSQKTYLGNDIQCIIYYIMYQKVFGRVPQVRIVNLLKNKVVAFQPNKKYIDTLLNKIIPIMVTQIKSGHFYKGGYFNFGCRNCPYIGLCEKDT